jgi:protein-L-isoaspartate(D-aspartate) O-methyltransferase
MDYATARFNMVEGQIRTNKVTDQALIGALRAVPRERFVPEIYRGIAYVDEDLHVGGGRYLIEPMVLGRLLQAASVKPESRVLAIGSATGYDAAVLGRIAGAVVALEADAALCETARRALAEVGAGNVTVVTGPLETGWPAPGPYDVILLSGTVASVPDAIRRQLAPKGRLVTVVRKGGVGQAMLMERLGDVYSSRVLFDAATPQLPGFEPVESFSF